MRQKISIRAIITQDEKVLVARRSNGRESILGKYELPGGSLGYNEQPQDTLKRYVKNNLGAQIESLQLADSLSFIDPDDSETQYVFIVYAASLRPGQLAAGGRYDKYMWQDMQNIQHNTLTSSTALLLGLIKKDDTTPIEDMIFENNVVENISDTAIIYSDGGSRGNPGPSASAFVITDSNERPIATGGSYLGITTNNQAEYQAVYQALIRAANLGLKYIDFRLDSNLVVNQLNGIYKIKNRDLWPIYQDIKNMLPQFQKITFSHVRREFNHVADALVNKILDEQPKNS